MIIEKEKPGQFVNFEFTAHDRNNCYFLCLNRINNVEKPQYTWVLNHLRPQMKSPRFKVSGILYKPSHVTKNKTLNLPVTTIYFNLLATGETNSFPLTQVIVEFLSREYTRIAETNF